MRALIIVLVIAATAGAATWLGLVLYKSRRQKDNTPTLDTVAKMLDGAYRDVDNVTGTIAGRAVTYSNRSTRYTAYTELLVSAPGAQVLLELRAKNLGDTPELVAGAPAIDANTILRELQTRIAKLHPKSIEVDEHGVKIVADRTIRDDADARELVQLGADLASRVKASIAPDDKAVAQRAAMRGAQAARRQKQIIGAAIVFAIIATGMVLGIRAMLERRKTTTQTDR